MKPSLGEGIRPCFSGLQAKGTASSPFSTTSVLYTIKMIFARTNFEKWEEFARLPCVIPFESAAFIE